MCLGFTLPYGALAAPASAEQQAAPTDGVASKTVLSDELRDSNASATDSAKKAMEALRAARAAVEEARSMDVATKGDSKQTKGDALPKSDASGRGLDKKGSADAGALPSKSSPKETPPVPKEAPSPQDRSPHATDAVPKAPLSKPEIPTAPPSAVRDDASKAPVVAPSTTTPPAASVPAAPAAAPAPAAGDVPKVDGAASAEGTAPQKRKSRFASSDDGTDEGSGRKKSRTKKEPAVPLTPEQAKAAEIKAFCDKARVAIKKGEYEVAQGLLESLVAVDLPHSEKKVALQEVATVYEEKGDLTKPIAIYEKLCSVLDTDADVPAWLLKLGQLYRDAGAYQMAISRYYGVIQLGMKMGSSDFTRYQGLTRQAQREVANTYFMKGDFEQAQKFYNMALRSDLSKEERAVAMFRSAHCTFMRSDMNGAVNALERFLKDYSRHASAAEARYMLATAYKNLGRPQDAYDTVIELLREAKGKADADPKAWAFWQKKAGNEFANDYYQRADFVNAVTIYQALAALEVAPEWRWPVVYQMGLCFERLRLEPRAVECYKYIVDENTKPEFRWKKMPQSVGNLVKMAAWRVEQLAWEGVTVKQLRSTAGTEVMRPLSR